MQEFTDAELVVKYLKGDSAALDSLIQRHFRQVFLFAKSYVKEDQQAEDITQEVFVKLWKNIKKFDLNKKFTTWLLQITKNTCIDYLRKTKKLVAAQTLDEDVMRDNLEKITDPAPLPEELLDSQGFADQLDSAIATLPESYALVVRLHLQQDLTFQEISEVLSQPLNTIKSRYRRALLGIRGNLGVNKAPSAPKVP